MTHHLIAQQRAWRQWQSTAVRPAGEQLSLADGLPVGPAAQADADADAVAPAPPLPMFHGSVAASPVRSVEPATTVPSDSESIGV